MNLSRRIYCNATTAFRPAAALKNIFFEPSSRRFNATNSSTDYVSLKSHLVPPEERLAGSRTNGKHGRHHAEREGATPAQSYTADASHGGLESESAPVNAVLQEQGAVYHNLQHDERSLQHTSGYSSEAVLADEEPSWLTDRTVFRSQRLANIVKKKLEDRHKEVLEYDGEYIQPVVQKKINTPLLPWIRNLDSDKTAHGLQKIGAEVESFAKWIRPTEAEAAARKMAIEQTAAIVRKTLKHFDVEIFGSSRSGLALATSDIDLRLFHTNGVKEPQALRGQDQFTPLPPRRQTRKFNLAALRRLQSSFERHEQYLSFGSQYARYPLLQLQHKPSGYDIQIVCSNDTTNQRARVAKYLERDDHLFDLYAVLKVTLETRGLSDVFKGGLGSYNLLIMIVAVLNKLKAQRQSSPAVTHDLTRRETIGSDLMHILDFYGQALDTYKYAVSADPFALHEKIDPVTLIDNGHLMTNRSLLHILDPTHPYLLCLEDPDDPTNDLGHKASSWKHIRQTLQCLHLEIDSRLHAPKYDGKISYLRQLVGSAFSSYAPKRRQAESYGLYSARLMNPGLERVRRGDWSPSRRKRVTRSQAERGNGGKPTSTETR